MPGLKRGLLITFEGAEGSGKSTQAQNAVEWFEERRIPHLFVREPGSTDTGELIRKFLLDPARAIHPRSEVLLFLAARSELVYTRILPALAQKKIVVADRFSDSTIAYQVYGRSLPGRLVRIMNRFASAGLKPDLTLLVDADAAIRHERGKTIDRMEKETDEYHCRVRQGYLAIARKAKKRVKVVDGSKSRDEVRDEVINILRAFLKRKGYQP